MSKLSPSAYYSRQRIPIKPFGSKSFVERPIPAPFNAKRTSSSHAVWLESPSRWKHKHRSDATRVSLYGGQILHGTRQIWTYNALYNKNSKEMVLRIYKTLTGRGYKVWMDDYDMKGDTLDAMAEAVEDSQIFIMCMSSGYLASKNCEKEAKFATNLDKTIIPLKMEKDFIPGRWLGIILGTKKFYDFSGKYPIEMKMGELLDEIKRIYKP